MIQGKDKVTVREFSDILSGVRQQDTGAFGATLSDLVLYMAVRHKIILGLLAFGGRVVVIVGGRGGGKHMKIITQTSLLRFHAKLAAAAAAAASFCASLPTSNYVGVKNRIS